MTVSEWRLWSHLRRRQLEGWKFRRQAPIGPYVVDFVCFAARLVVELDGSSHNEAVHDYDERRQAWLESQGFIVLRLSADYPEMDPLEGAWDTIDLALTEIGARSRPSPAISTGRLFIDWTPPPALRATSPASGEDITGCS